jgi:hypothetical protein
MKTLGSALRWAAAAWLVCLLPSPAAADIPPEERQVLLEIYRSTHGDEWTDHTDWNGEPGTECEWFGVRCGRDEAHVQVIVLDRNGLSGPLPGRLNQLKFLRSFSAIGNQLTGPIPALAGMQGLEYFNVSENQISGALPDLSGLARLTSIRVDHNLLSGPLPRMTGLSALEFFEAGHNRLTGPIPRLEGLASLKMLHLGGNQFTGTVPDLSGAPNLLEIDFSDNQLTGALPAPPRSLLRASLCPNRLDHPSKDERIDAAWSRLTTDKPWSKGCR